MFNGWINNTKCENCGSNNKKDATFCHSCGAKIGGGEVTCGKCGTKNESNNKFCRKCGANLQNSEKPVVNRHRWQRGDEDFAVKILAHDLPGMLRTGIMIDAGTNAMLLEGGANRGLLAPGTHVLETVGEKIKNWIESGIGSQVSVLLVSVTPTTILMNIGSVYTSDPIQVSADLSLELQVENPVPFLVNMLGSRERLSKQDLIALLEPEVRYLVNNWLKKQTIQELSENLQLKGQFELMVLEELRKTFEQNGLKLNQIKTVTFDSELIDKDRGIKNKYALQISSAEAELTGRVRMADVLHQVDLQELIEETRKIEIEEKRVGLYDRMRRAVMAGKMDEARTEKEFDDFLEQMDDEKLLKNKEKEELKRTWREDSEDHDLARAFFLNKLESERDFELSKIEIIHRFDLDVLRKDLEIKISRQTTDYEIELKQKISRAEILNDRERDEYGRQKKRLDLEISALEREDIFADAEMGIKLEALRNENQRIDYEERLRIDREHQIILDKHNFEIESARFEQKLREKMLDSEIRIKELQTLGELGTEALISASGPEQAALLADLKKTDYLKHLSEDQILAMAAANSPEVARAITEKFKAMADGKVSEQEKSLYERMLKDMKDMLEKNSNDTKANTQSQVESMKYSLDKITEIATTYARQGQASPIIVPGAGNYNTSPTHIHQGNGQPPQHGSGETKICINCGRTSEVNASFCVFCGDEFKGMR